MLVVSGVHFPDVMFIFPFIDEDTKSEGGEESWLSQQKS